MVVSRRFRAGGSWLAERRLDRRHHRDRRQRLWHVELSAHRADAGFYLRREAAPYVIGRGDPDAWHPQFSLTEGATSRELAPRGSRTAATVP